MRVRFNVKGFIDRRSLVLHASHDKYVEQEWRRRVANHPLERRRLERERQIQMVERMANVGSDRSGGSTTTTPSGASGSDLPRSPFVILSVR